MAHPKSRISKSRKRKRRTHIKASVPVLNICPLTGTYHQRHRAYWYLKEDETGQNMVKQLIYRNQIVMEKSVRVKAGEENS